METPPLEALKILDYLDMQGKIYLKYSIIAKYVADTPSSVLWE